MLQRQALGLGLFYWTLSEGSLDGKEEDPWLVNVAALPIFRKLDWKDEPQI